MRWVKVDPVEWEMSALPFANCSVGRSGPEEPPTPSFAVFWAILLVPQTSMFQRVVTFPFHFGDMVLSLGE